MVSLVSRLFTTIVHFTPRNAKFKYTEDAKKNPSPYSKVGGDTDAPMYETALPVNAAIGETIAVN